MRMTTIDLVKAVLGAVIAFLWAMIGGWLGVRRARALDPGQETLTGNAGNGPAVCNE